MALMKVEISDGPREGLKTVGVPSFQGHTEYLSIEERFLAKRGDDLLLPVRVVGFDRKQKVYLIQLPLEADSGANRVWVREALLRERPDEVPA